MSKSPNYEAVVTGTLNRTLQQWASCGRSEFLVEYNTLHNELINLFYPVYFIQDDFTVATLVRQTDNKTMFVGVSKRNVEDPKLPIRGKSLSLSRAVRSLILNRIHKMAECEQNDQIRLVDKFIDDVEVSSTACLTKA